MSLGNWKMNMIGMEQVGEGEIFTIKRQQSWCYSIWQSTGFIQQVHVWSSHWGSTTVPLENKPFIITFSACTSTCVCHHVNNTLTYHSFGKNRRFWDKTEKYERKHSILNNIVVQFYPWFKFCLVLFEMHYHTLSHSLTKENKIQTNDKIIALQHVNQTTG